MLQHGTTPATTAPTDPVLARFVASLKRTRSPKTLELHQKRLQFLAQNLDPFAGDISPECQQILDLYGLEDSLMNPFGFTNTLLQMLDLLEERTRPLST